MEGSLSRDEQKELMSLLGLHGSYWGAFSVMRKAYLEKCKEYHPDKGGDENKMKRMNELYKVVVEALRESSQPCSSWSSSEVKFKLYKSSADHFYMKNWGFCNYGLSMTCYCLMCHLRRRHTERRKNKEKLLWNRCYCYECFRDWFGLDNQYNSFLFWQDLVSQVTTDHLHL
uniref:Small t antigen n=1 Tax=Betapolyomavirus callosciuri TaxID=2721749 RepID=A0A6G9LWA4_9POLY|nr:small T antigen [Betapolyomavirus callosciuri]QIQ69393.1 small T antigen [Betapolyomavirus callosciuri]